VANGSSKSIRALEAVGQAVGGFVVAGHADQGRRRAERGNVQGDVGGATGTILDMLDPDHRHRCLGGNP
jgi:hypothetical protein